MVPLGGRLMVVISYDQSFGPASVGFQFPWPLFRNTVFAMPMTEILGGLGALDGAALALLVFGWLGIGWRIEHPGRRPSVSALMARYRRAWMREMLSRDQRIFDAAILQNQRDGTAFFGSTCLIAIGGVLALAGNPTPLLQVAAQLPRDSGTLPAPLIWQAKLLLVVLILAVAFLRFVWSNRLFGYFSVLIGAVPTRRDDPVAAHRSAQAADLNIRAAIHFNRGLRSLYFALSSLAWLIGPVALFLAVSMTIWVLYDREFLSESRALLNDRPPEDPVTRP